MNIRYKNSIAICILIFATKLLIGQPDTYQNPVLPGFHPDPSVCRVGDDYYLVNSTFEWYPGLPIYHSKDLVNWELIGHAIHRPDQVELPEGLKDSRGLYAPAIRYHEGVFYVINTCVQCGGNFYVTATNPAGPWSDPVWLHSRGIDPSLFWDDDGKCYYQGHANITGVNDWPQKNGVWMQELDLEKGELVGEQKQLTHGHATNARWTEGPHLYKIENTYILLVAEGGTGFHHAVTAFHSENLWGPYIPYHSNPILSHRHLGNDYPVQATGHADWVETPNGEWWAFSLAKRKFMGKTLLARETFLMPMKFENQEGIPTPVLNPGEGKIPMQHKRPDLPWTPVEPVSDMDTFEGKELGLHWNFLRTPYEKWYRLENGDLNLACRPGVVDSLVNPSFIARRIQHHEFEISTQLEFSTKKENEKAGLVIYRNSNAHYQLLKGKKTIELIKTIKDDKRVVAIERYDDDKVILKAVNKGLDVVFYFGSAPDMLKQLGEKQDISIISDEVSGQFNGPYVGMYATGTGSESKNEAVFQWFRYCKVK